MKSIYVPCKDKKDHMVRILEAGEKTVESKNYCTSDETRIEHFGQTYRQVIVCIRCGWHLDPIRRG